MPDHLFLCGLSPTQRAGHEGGRELHLRGPKKNLRLQLDDVRRQLLESEHELLTDLVEIATYVFAADNLIARGGDALKNMGKAWRRSYRLVIAVRRPGIWSEPQLLHALREVLGFLSDDSWDFEFVTLDDAPYIQGYLNIQANSNAGCGGKEAATSTIVLFSGGLDSFAGAVHELLEGDHHVVLLSRRIGGMIDSRQRELASELARIHPGRITHVRVSGGLTNETKAVEHSQRTRSFLLTAMALVAAEIEQTDQIRFYENGIMSVNLPISTQVVGTRSSRSTHPRALMLLQGLCRLIRRGNTTIENPFTWRTKVEVVKELAGRSESKAIPHTLSCSRSRQTTYHPHCGKCAQCLQRRLATLGAGVADTDPGESYAVDLLLGRRLDEMDRAMAVDIIRSALEFRMLSDVGFATRYAGEFAWLTTSFPGLAPGLVARNFVAMFRRHGDAVRSIFMEAAGLHASALIDHTLPPDCLLQLAVNSPDINIDRGPVLQSPQREERLGASEEEPNPELVRLAVDTRGKCIVIDVLAPLRGPTEFRLMSVLVDLHRQDRAAERAPENYRTMAPADLAQAASSTGEVAGRKAISRLRNKINKEYQQLYGSTLDANAIIENVRGKGYRLNPSVLVVALDQLQRC